MRYDFIEKVVAISVVECHESREHKRSVKIDRILTGKYTALPVFFGIMFLVFFLTFNVIGSTLSDWLSLGIDKLTDLADKGLTAYGINPVVHSLIIDGVFAGVGSVLSFLPIIVTLFFFLSILEDTGYMARVAFVMDKLLRKIGLSGRSFVPMLIGFGCSVPAIMATRTLVSDRDRKMTILLTPYMSCSAKIPIYAVFCAAFFKKYQALGLIHNGHSAWDNSCTDTEKYSFPWQACAVCNGASKLSSSFGKKRRTSSLGQGKGLYTKSFHSNILCDYHNMVS